MAFEYDEDVASDPAAFASAYAASRAYVPATSASAVGTRTTSPVEASGTSTIAQHTFAAAVRATCRLASFGATPARKG